jgi:hypothetical protein
MNTNPKYKKHSNNPFLKRNSTRQNSYQQKKKETAINLSIESFPNLDTKKRNINNIDNIDNIDYTKIKIETPDIEEDINTKNPIAPGWVVIKKENNKIVKKYGPPTNLKIYKTIPKMLIEEVNKTYQILSIHWNNYRDEINDLLGEQSEYWNYKKEINKIYKEDLSILNQINNQFIVSNSDEEDELYNDNTDNYDYY